MKLNPTFILSTLACVLIAAPPSSVRAQEHDPSTCPMHAETSGETPWAFTPLTVPIAVIVNLTVTVPASPFLPSSSFS